MAKIIHLPVTKHIANVSEFLEDSIPKFEDEEIEIVILAGKAKDGRWVTGYFHADFGTRMEAIGHINADVIDDMLLANAERYNL